MKKKLHKRKQTTPFSFRPPFSSPTILPVPKRSTCRTRSGKSECRSSEDRSRNYSSPHQYQSTPCPCRAGWGGDAGSALDRVPLPVHRRHPPLEILTRCTRCLMVQPSQAGVISMGKFRDCGTDCPPNGPGSLGDLPDSAGRRGRLLCKLLVQMKST